MNPSFIQDLKLWAIWMITAMVFFYAVYAWNLHCDNIFIQSYIHNSNKSTAKDAEILIGNFESKYDCFLGMVFGGNEESRSIVWGDDFITYLKYKISGRCLPFFGAFSFFAIGFCIFRYAPKE